MTDSLTTITSDQKDALQLVELVERLVAYGGMYSDHAYGGMYSDHALELATTHLVTATSRGASPHETDLIAACVEFLVVSMGD